MYSAYNTDALVNGGAPYEQAALRSTPSARRAGGLYIVRGGFTGVQVNCRNPTLIAALILFETPTDLSEENQEMWQP
jgi:hypothetical protein